MFLIFLLCACSLPCVAYVFSLLCIMLFLLAPCLALLQAVLHVVIGGWSPSIVTCSCLVLLLLTFALH